MDNEDSTATVCYGLYKLRYRGRVEIERLLITTCTDRGSAIQLRDQYAERDGWGVNYAIVQLNEIPPPKPKKPNTAYGSTIEGRNRIKRL